MGREREGKREGTEDRNVTKNERKLRKVAYTFVYVDFFL